MFVISYQIWYDFLVIIDLFFMQKQKEKVCVIGLGYVGFPLAILAASKGYEVFGYDKAERVITFVCFHSGLDPKLQTGPVPVAPVKNFS